MLEGKPRSGCGPRGFPALAHDQWPRPSAGSRRSGSILRGLVAGPRGQDGARPQQLATGSTQPSKPLGVWGAASKELEGGSCVCVAKAGQTRGRVAGGEPRRSQVCGVLAAMEELCPLHAGQGARR